MNHAAHDQTTALPIEQSVLLWCIRMQVLGLKRGADVQPRIDVMLDALGVAGASAGLAAFVGALSRGCTRMIDVRCVCHTQVDPDEAALLDVLSLAQALRSFEALLILRGFSTQAGAVAALRAAEAVGTALAQAGRFLPEPEQEMRHFAFLQSELAMPAASETVH